MIEVHRHGSGWRWSFIGNCGQVLWQDTVEYLTDFAAWNAAKNTRSRFHKFAKDIDHA